MKAKLTVHTVHSVVDYKSFLSSNEKPPSLSDAIDIRATLEEMLADNTSDFTNYLQRLDDEERVLLISALITNDQKAFSHILFPSLLDKFDDSSILENIVLHDRGEAEGQWLNKTCLALIKRVLEEDNGVQLPLAHCQRIMALAMGRVPDSVIDLPSKLAIHTEIIPMSDNYLNLTYKEKVTPLTSNKFAGDIKLNDYFLAVQKPDLDQSEYLFLTLGVLQKYSLQNEHLKSRLAQCRQLYMETHYDEAIKVIADLCSEYKEAFGEEICTAILEAQTELQEVSLYRNYSRRFFENRVAALYQGQCINAEAIEGLNRIAVAFLKHEAKLATTPKEAIVSLLSLDEFEDGELTELELKLKEQSTDWQSRGRFRKATISSEYQRAQGRDSDVVLTRNRGVMRSSQPNFPDELSQHALENKGPDIYYSASDESYESKHQRSSFIASISGHAFLAAALLITYLERNPSSATNNQDINHFLKMYASFYASEGFHSLLEVMDTFNQAHIKEIFAEHGVIIDTPWPDFILEQAFKDSQEYTKKLCHQQVTGEQLSSRLHTAVRRGALESVITLLEQGHDPNKVSVQGVTPLILALRRGHRGMIKVLLEAGAEPTQSLFIAIKEQDETVVRKLLQEQIDISLTVDGYDLIQYAGQYGNIEIEELLLHYFNQRIEACRGKIDSINTAYSHPTRRSVVEGLKNFVIAEETKIDDLLVLERALRIFFILDSVSVPMTKEGAMQEIEGQPFIFMALGGERDDLVAAALDAGADPNVRLIDGCTPLFMAVEHNKGEVASLLIVKNADVNLALYESGYSPLHMAVASDNGELITALVAAGATIEQDSEFCDSPLALAVKNGHVTSATLLIDAGANPNGLSVEGTSLITLAIQKRDFLMVNLLIEKGAFCDQADKDNLLIHAFYDHDVDMLRFFLSIGAFVDAHGDDGEPLLCIAARKGFFEIAEALLKAGTNPDCFYNYASEEFQNLNALQMAIKSGHPNIVTLLLEHGANTWGSDRKGRTMIQLAKEHNQHLIVRLLEGFVADKMSLLRAQIEALANRSDNKSREGAFMAVKEFAEKIEEKPESFQLLEARIHFFVNLDEQHQRYLKLLAEGKIRRNKIDEVDRCFEREFNNVKDNTSPYSAAGHAQKAIDAALFHAKLKLFDPHEKEADSSPPSPDDDYNVLNG